jgi:hypothetical protein
VFRLPRVFTTEVLKAYGERVLKPMRFEVGIVSGAMRNTEKGAVQRYARFEEDACDFGFPTGPLVIFMWNHFVGPVFDRVLANLEDSLRREPREVYVLYLKPDCAHRLDASPWLQKLWECHLEMTEHDFAAYQLGGRSEICAAYRSSASAEADRPGASSVILR